MTRNNDARSAVLSPLQQRENQLWEMSTAALKVAVERANVVLPQKRPRKVNYVNAMLSAEYPERARHGRARARGGAAAVAT